MVIPLLSVTCRRYVVCLPRATRFNWYRRGGGCSLLVAFTPSPKIKTKRTRTRLLDLQHETTRRSFVVGKHFRSHVVVGRYADRLRNTYASPWTLTEDVADKLNLSVNRSESTERSGQKKQVN